MVWDPARITPRPWASVLESYRHLEDRNTDFGPLRGLVEQVVASARGSSLFAATSGTALLVAPQADADWKHDALRIDVGLSGSIRFVLPAKPPTRPTTFERDGEKVGVAFESFLRDARWLERR
jgi:hypothetical protein